MATPSFVDRVTLTVVGGHGGNGCASVYREKFRPFGGPDGGNGGRGGDVVLVVDEGLSTLVDYHHGRRRAADNGRQGRGGHRNGAQGADVTLPVPPGTVVRTPDGELLADLVGAGETYVAAPGGRGGLGNAALATPNRRAPGFALLGEPGTERTVVLELKVVADVGLVGFPSAGKSSLVAAMSRARPKIADYPFTTLVPNLGVVTAGEQTFTMADVPGLIPGASRGRGLGDEFLRHIERCSVLCHVIDCATPEPDRDPISDLDVIEAELAAYRGGGELADRPRIVVLNKVDVPEAADLAELVRPELAARGLEVLAVSAATHAGLTELAYALAGMVARHRQSAPPVEPARAVLRPAAVADERFAVRRDGGVWRVTGQRPERWVRQTDFANDEAVGYLADRLARLGVEERLRGLGVRAGDTVVIGSGDDAVVFDFDPDVVAGAEILHGPRGSDPRLEGR